MKNLYNLIFNVYNLLNFNISIICIEHLTLKILLVLLALNLLSQKQNYLIQISLIGFQYTVKKIKTTIIPKLSNLHPS